MAVPQKKTSKSRNGMRQAGKGFKLRHNVFVDENGNFAISHNKVAPKRERKNSETENNVATE